MHPQRSPEDAPTPADAPTSAGEALTIFTLSVKGLGCQRVEAAEVVEENQLADGDNMQMVRVGSETNMKIARIPGHFCIFQYKHSST